MLVAFICLVVLVAMYVFVYPAIVNYVTNSGTCVVSTSDLKQIQPSEYFEKLEVMNNEHEFKTLKIHTGTEVLHYALDNEGEICLLCVNWPNKSFYYSK